MSYCENGDLHSVLQQHKANSEPHTYISEDVVLLWFVQLALAIRHCHTRNIIHRDIKTKNIFLTSTNVVKLGDFGIARSLSSTMAFLATSVVGTPYSMSPEICENKPYSYESDIWALGCVLYEMCALKDAFRASNLLGLVSETIAHCSFCFVCNCKCFSNHILTIPPLLLLP